MKNIIAAIVLSATAFGANAASFDCAKATTKSEKFICENESISALDSKLHEVYVKAVKIDPSLKQEQRNWNKTVRDTMINIGQIQPLEAVYNAQIQNLMNVLPKEETASESVSETSVKVEEEQPKQEEKVVEDPKKEKKPQTSEFTLQCESHFKWQNIDGTNTKPKEQPFYKEYNPGELTLKVKDGQIIHFTYIDNNDVHKANTKRVVDDNGMIVFSGWKDNKKYYVWREQDSDIIRLEVREQGYSKIYVDQYGCR